jgi:hypothetical protein
MVIGPGPVTTSVENAAVDARSEPAAFRSVSRMKSISGVSFTRAESALQRSGVVPIGVVT